jgi:esterase/lipase superfamily enzyme
MSKVSSRWYSERIEREVDVVRWGTFGTPVLVFPTAGGDAEEIERFHLVAACAGLLDAGRVKLYSVDSINGRVLLSGEGDSGRQAWIHRQFFEFLRHEVVPAIRRDCGSEQIEIVAAGPSIGAFNALVCACWFPDVFKAAVCMSGTYDLGRFFDGPIGDDFALSSAQRVLGGLDEAGLDRLRDRFVVLASGEGANENIGESWAVAHALGSRGVPNRVDPWGPHWEHDWPLWRVMLPQYLDELA